MTGPLERILESADLPTLAAALLLVARVHTDSPDVAIRFNGVVLATELPADQPLSALADEARRLLAAPGPATAATPIAATASIDPGAVRVAVTSGGTRVLDHWARALGLLRTAPAIPLGEADLRNGDERARLTAVSINEPAPVEATITGLFDEQVRARGTEVALIDPRGPVTYAELARRADALAARVAALGAGPARPVAVLLGKGTELVTALLGALRAGAAYVPIDPASPPARRDELLRDAGAAVLVTDRMVEAPQGVHLVAPGHAGGEAPVVNTQPGDRAYVMYTSGSTGRPKGVVVSHRAVVSRVIGPDYVTLGPGTRLLQTGSVAFDAATFEIWAPLLNGGTLVFDGDGVPTPESLRAALPRHGITTMFLTTALFHQLADLDPGCFGDVELLVGGEAISAPHLSRAIEACPRAGFVNGYGPTENTFFSTTHRIERPPSGDVPIGRPIAGSRVAVMSFEGRPQPIGVAGELWVGGAGVADGYLGRPELTAERFTQLADGTRWYRTGDRARWSDDLRLEFLGRLDTQVKLSGYRIELAEVEARLRECPGVLDAVVVARDSTLAAYYTSDGPIDPAELRRRLRDRLPAYMVPALCERLVAFPLTANHKVDRDALARRQPETAGPGTLSLPDRVSRVFAEVLGVPAVGPADNFFDLGGNSLLAMRVWSRLRAELGRDFNLRHVIDSPTAAELADVLAQPATDGTRRPPLFPRPRPAGPTRQEQL